MIPQHYDSLLELGGAVIKVMDENPDADMYFSIRVQPKEDGTKLFSLSVFGASLS